MVFDIKYYINYFRVTNGSNHAAEHAETCMKKENCSVLSYPCSHSHGNKSGFGYKWLIYINFLQRRNSILSCSTYQILLSQYSRRHRDVKLSDPIRETLFHLQEIQFKRWSIENHLGAFTSFEIPPQEVQQRYTCIDLWMNVQNNLLLSFPPVRCVLSKFNYHNVINQCCRIFTGVTARSTTFYEIVC